jgi:hypothetical protein
MYSDSSLPSSGCRGCAKITESEKRQSEETIISDDGEFGFPGAFLSRNCALSVPGSCMMFSSPHDQAALTILQIMLKLIRIPRLFPSYIWQPFHQKLTYNPQRLVPIYTTVYPMARKAILVSSNLNQSVLLCCRRLWHIPRPSIEKLIKRWGVSGCES